MMRKVLGMFTLCFIGFFGLFIFSSSIALAAGVSESKPKPDYFTEDTVPDDQKTTPAPTKKTPGDSDSKSSGDFGLSFVSGKGLVEQSAGAVIGNLVQWVLGIVGVLLLIMLIYGGILYMISGGNEDQIGTAKKVLTYAMFGVVIIAIAFALTRAIINALLGA